MSERRGRRRGTAGGGRRVVRGALAALAAWLGALAPPAAAQQTLMGLADPEMGVLGLRSDYRITIVPEQAVEGQPAEHGMTQHDFTLTTPVRQDARDEWAVSARLRSQQFDTRAILPDTGEPFPDELWDVRIGTTYRHRFDRGWIGGANLTVGSPSDEPFASLDEVAVSLTGLLRVPRGERNAWLFFLNYDNRRDFLPNVPLPGFGYHYRPSDALDVMLATGFVAVEYAPIEKLSVRFTYAVIRTVDVRVTYQVLRPVRLWAGFDWTSEDYLRADRRDSDDQLFYYEKRVRVGAIVGLARWAYVDLDVGYTFDRFYFEGEGYSDRHDNRVDVESGPFAQFRLGVRF